jgi:hypothetical protein
MHTRHLRGTESDMRASDPAKLLLLKTATWRQDLLAEHAQATLPGDKCVDLDEYLNILSEAVAARNGWKRTLMRCALRKRLHARRDTAETSALVPRSSRMPAQ